MPATSNEKDNPTSPNRNQNQNTAVVPPQPENVIESESERGYQPRHPVKGPFLRVKLDTSVAETRTQQQFADETDINAILRKYQRTGVIDHVNRYGAQYGDIDHVDYHQAMNIVTQAEQMFQDLPSHIRRRCNGDPAEFLEFVQDPANADELRELGLMEGDTSPATTRESTPERLPTASSDDSTDGPTSESSDE